jgi:hypothetical protein
MAPCFVCALAVSLTDTSGPKFGGRLGYGRWQRNDYKIRSIQLCWVVCKI